jgi:hypothetical protein
MPDTTLDILNNLSDETLEQIKKELSPYYFALNFIENVLNSNDLNCDLSEIDAVPIYLNYCNGELDDLYFGKRSELMSLFHREEMNLERRIEIYMKAFLSDFILFILNEQRIHKEDKSFGESVLSQRLIHDRVSMMFNRIDENIQIESYEKYIIKSNFKHHIEEE